MLQISVIVHLFRALLETRRDSEWNKFLGAEVPMPVLKQSPPQRPALSSNAALGRCIELGLDSSHQLIRFPIEFRSAETNNPKSGEETRNPQDCSSRGSETFDVDDTGAQSENGLQLRVRLVDLGIIFLENNSDFRKCYLRKVRLTLECHGNHFVLKTSLSRFFAQDFKCNKSKI